MYGRKQDPTKFRNTYANVNYNDFILNKNKKRKYSVTCKICGIDRGYKIHNEALRPCLKCHTKNYTKKTKEQRKLYGCIKANINARFKNRNIVKERGTFRYLPYTIGDLIKHLEAQFEPWMNWSNHGPYNKNKKTWQIDHIVADSCFAYNSPEDQGFKDSWALSNLRPLESMTNILKSNK
jgi:hypothetical protein